MVNRPGHFAFHRIFAPRMKRFSSLLLVLIAFVFVAKTTVTAFYPGKFVTKATVVSDWAESEGAEETEEGDESGDDNSLSAPEPAILLVFHAVEAAPTSHVLPLLTASVDIISPPPQA